MPHSSASAVKLLPFGSLTGVVPIDAIKSGRGDGGERTSEVQRRIHSVIDPASSTPRGRRL